MRQPLSYFFNALALASLVTASSCNHNSNNQPPNRNDGGATERTPDNKSGKNSETPAPVVGSDQPGEVTFFGKGQVWLRVQGSESFAPRASGSFRSGDRLKVGEDSFATILCPDRMCELRTGEFDNCCGDTCTQIAQMLRIGQGDNPPLVKKADLPAAEARTLIESDWRAYQSGWMASYHAAFWRNTCAEAGSWVKIQPQRRC